METLAVGLLMCLGGFIGVIAGALAHEWYFFGGAAAFTATGGFLVWKSLR